MKQTIIHIGYHKTGTTWFQKNFYPILRNVEYLDRNFVQELFIKKRPFDFDEYEIKNTISDIDFKNKRLIICDEELSGNIHSSGLQGCLTKEMGYRLKSVFPDAKIIIFIRNQIDMIASIYLQYLKKGGNYNINEYLYHPKNVDHRYPLFSFDHLNYQKIIKYYEKLFGKNNVHVYLYEDFSKNNETFIKNYASTFDLDYNLKDIDFTKRNIGYKRCTFYLSKFFNIFTKYDVLNKYYLIDIPYSYKISRLILNKINKSMFFHKVLDSEDILGDNNIKYIMQYYKKCNQELRTEYNLNLDSYNYPL